MLKRTTFKDSNIHPEAKVRYLINHGFQDWGDIFTKNNLGITMEQLHDMTYEDLQKYVYLANNFFTIDNEDKFVTDVVSIRMEDFFAHSLAHLHIGIKDAIEIFREENGRLIN